jgi:hypothetical protein
VVLLQANRWSTRTGVEELRQLRIAGRKIMD